MRCGTGVIHPPRLIARAYSSPPLGGDDGPADRLVVPSTKTPSSLVSGFLSLFKC